MPVQVLVKFSITTFIVFFCLHKLKFLWLLLYFCCFICHLSCSLIVTVGLIIFLVFTKYYKVRVRDYTVPIYQIAEEHAERYLQSEWSSGSVPQS